MKVGIFADSHDHLDNIRRVVELFNNEQVECVLFAGDLVSTFAVPPLRQLNCRLLGCFGDNEGNRAGLLAGMKVIGEIREAPAAYTLVDGTRVVIVHMARQLAGYAGDFDIAICGHTHKPRIHQDDQGRLWINPGEASGWTYGEPSVALLDTLSRSARIVPLDVSAPLPPWNEDRRRRAAEKSRGSPDRESGVTED